MDRLTLDARARVAPGPPAPLPRRPAALGAVAVVYGVSAGGAVLEAVGLKAAGMVAALPLAPQATALPALAAFADARWILVYGTSWPALAGEALAAVAVQAAVLAAVVRAAWPGPARPGFGRLVARCAVATALAMVAMSPWATLSFIGGVVSLSFPVVGAIVGAFVTGVLVLPHAGMAPRWWAAWPPWRAVAWTATSFVLLMAAATAIAASPGWLMVVPAAAGGAANGWCLRRVVAAAAGAAPGHLRWRSALVPAGMAGATVATLAVLVAALGSLLMIAVPHWRHTQPPPRRGQQVVVLVKGFESDWNGSRPSLAFPGSYVTEFSYRGQGAHGRPLAYKSTFTDQPLGRLASKMARQFARLRRVSGRRLDVLAVSEGTLVVRQYLVEHPHAPLRDVVLDSPLPRPDDVYYPGAGRTGFGIAGGAEARLLTRLVDAENGKAALDPSIPMLRSLVRHGPLFRQRSLCPVAGIRIEALLPLSAAMANPPGPLSGVPTEVLPGVHANLLSLASARRVVAGFFAGRAIGPSGPWAAAYQVLRGAAAAWEAPPLPLGASPVWRRHGGARGGDAAFGTYGCPARDRPGSAPP